MAKRISGKEYENWSKEELTKELIRLRSTTYGLVWKRDLPEEKIDILVNPDARTPSEMFSNEVAGKPFPVLKEVKSKLIETNKEQPTNILIEGDNYHSLAVLNFTHQAAVDLIYIDPPYNTGNSDFIYNDKFVDKEDSFRHSKWLSFMEKRLKLARNLLKPSGAIFISIDDHEQAPLKMLCDEIFGEENFAAQIVWKKKAGGGSDSKYFVTEYEYVLCYLKDAQIRKSFDVEYSDEEKQRFDQEDKNGKYYLKTLERPDRLGKRPNLQYAITCPDGSEIEYKEKDKKYTWVVSRKTLQEMLENNEIVFRKIKEEWRVFRKVYMKSRTPRSLYDQIGLNREATQELKDLFGNPDIFSNPKPLSLLKEIIRIFPKTDTTVLDFFAGSGTTGHAVLEMNADGGNRRFILCTNNGDEKADHRIASDICHVRIKKAISGYKNEKGEQVAGLGGNLRYYKTDFVEAEPTDRNKRKLVKESTDMLCIHEDAFELVSESEEFKIFRNHEKYLGIVFYEEAIGEYKEAIKKIDGHFNTYVFSLGEDPHEHLFDGVLDKVTLCAIPEAVLKVYREIFK